MKLQFTKQAREEFLRIVSVFAEYAGPRSAEKFIKRVNDRGETLLKHPEIGHPEIRDQDNDMDSRYMGPSQ